MDEETMAAGFGVAAYHLQVSTLAALVVGGALTMADAVTAIEHAETACRRVGKISPEAKIAAQTAFSALLKSYRERH